MSSFRRGVSALVAATAALHPSGALAQKSEAAPESDGENIEHTIIVGVGGAGEVELAGGAFHPGANVMVEWDAIESWLELELSASVLAADGGVEVPVELLLKKPFRLSRRAEVMIGLGPEVVHVATPGVNATYFGGALALDFMVWPWDRRVGLWAEPEYDLVLRDGVSHGLGATGGLLLGW